MKRLNTAFWAGVVAALLVQACVFAIEIWLNLGGLSRPWRSWAPLFRDLMYSSGVPANEPLVLSASSRVLLAVVSFATGATWMWLKSAGEAQTEGQ